MDVTGCVSTRDQRREQRSTGSQHAAGHFLRSTEQGQPYQRDHHHLCIRSSPGSIPRQGHHEQVREGWNEPSGAGEPVPGEDDRRHRGQRRHQSRGESRPAALRPRPGRRGIQEEQQRESNHWADAPEQDLSAEESVRRLTTSPHRHSKAPIGSPPRPSNPLPG